MILTRQQIAEIVDIAKLAGEIAKSAFLSKNFTIKHKQDGSCLTSVDTYLSKFIGEGLAKISDIPIICEENNLRGLNLNNFFLVDPIDGTNQFAFGNSEFCINIALISGNKPVFGIINAPLMQSKGVLAYNYGRQIFVNDTLFLPKKKTTDCLKILTSPRTSNIDITNFIDRFLPKSSYQISTMSSATKFLQLLLGEENFYLHLRSSMAWDTASGHALFIYNQLAKINTLNNDELLYFSDNLQNPSFFIDMMR
jgi:3'(2'), 5'-bisphosphate nucleotidase